MNEKKQIRKLIVAAVLFIATLLLIAVSFTGCSTLDRCIDTLEYDHYNFYNNTKAVFVVRRVNKTLYCQSPSGLKFYKIHEEQPLPDTIILSEHKWVYAEARFINRIPYER